MNMCRYCLSAGVAFLLAGPALAQSAEPPASTTAPSPAGAEAQGTQPMTPPAPMEAGDHAGHQKGHDHRDKAGHKDGKPVQQPK